ncbi:uncharacterized protein [Embiotoca jacksoni]|uniref:uncharacterized protein n=1 Tax=Embiotoca jacksoni TaxID=100190 RepID=UPI003703E5F7
MKPVSYQSMPSPVSGGRPNLGLDCVLSPSKVMYCEKCGFASKDAALFKKHMIEHMGTRFYCFYCNAVSFSEAELNAHLKQHTSNYPFKCPHCGRGYMRRLCLVKHIDRLHSKSISQEPSKPGVTKSPQGAVSSALASVPAADPSPLRPLVRVTVPAPSAPAVRLGKDEQRGKTPDTNGYYSTNGTVECLSPLNGLIQHNRALTVSLPEEVTIPAGCLVELVEVKTVNGSKELKLRLVSQQENESVIKDARTAVPQNSALGKPLSSALNHPNTARPMSMGMCTVNSKQCEAKAATAERPAAAPVSVSNHLPNQVRKEQSGFKRASQEIINLDSHTVVQNKVAKSILHHVREGSGGIRATQTAPASHNAAPSTVISNRATSRLSAALHPDSMATRVCHKAVDERKSSNPEPYKGIPPRRASDTKNLPRDVPMAVKLEPGAISLKNNNTTTKTIKEPAPLSQQSLKSAPPSSSVPAAAQVRPPAISVGKDNVANQSFPLPRTLNKPLSIKTPVLSHHSNSKISTWSQEVRSNETTREGHASEPQSFPVISSVFSLSQQPEDVQGPIQPLVMALRGIVMENSCGSTTPDQFAMKDSAEERKKVSTPGDRAQAASKNGAFTRDALLTEQTSESVKLEGQDKSIQHPPAPTHNHVHVKEEKNGSAPTDGAKCKRIPAPKSSTDEEFKVGSRVEATADALQRAAINDPDVSSKFLTVSLKRVQVGVWKKNKKGLKLRISKYKAQVPVESLSDCTVIYPMPLKVDQPVKRPGPNQPVVVLNHPKPRTSAQATRADAVADTGAPGVVPKCQILKMRLSKVMGQKYEVMGCTVGVFP